MTSTAGDRDHLLGALVRRLGDGADAAQVCRELLDALTHLAEGVLVAAADDAGELRAPAAAGARADGALLRRAFSENRSVFDASRATAAFPLCARGRALGAAALVRARPLGDDEVALATDLAGVAGLALENARLERAAEAARARARKLELTAAALAGATTVEDVARVAVEQVSRALGAQSGALALVEPDGLRVVSPDGGTPATLAEPAGAGAPDVVRGAAHVATVPLMLDERPFGVAWFGFDAPRRQTVDEDALRLAIGRQAAQAIARAQLFEAERRARSRAERTLALMRRLEDVTRHISRVMSADAMARAAIDHATEAVGADSTAFFLLDEAAGCLRLFESVGLIGSVPQQYATVPLERDAPLIDAVRRCAPVMTSRRSELVARYPASDERMRAAGNDRETAIACLPLVVDGRPLGAVVFTWYREHVVEEDEQRFLTLVADHCALALARTHAFEALRDSADRAERACDAARRAEQLKDQFLAMLGHELRNPLAPILTALELMRLRGAPDEHERVVIERQVKHLERLVDDLLDISRITRGKVDLKLERVDVARVVAKAIELASPLLESRRHRLDTDGPRLGPYVHGDHVRLCQIVTNLLLNAAKYTAPGGRIQLTVEATAAEVVVRVRDNGVGIAPDLLPQVFDMFVQAPQTLDRAQGGLGLGLTIVRTLVELHSGRVLARSEGPGRGSEFEVRLPRAADAAPAATPRRVPLRRQIDPATRRRVLVVDDNEDAARLLADLLTAVGHATAVAFDGPAALETARLYRPDVVLLDIGLPVMDGFEVARRLREEVLVGAPLRLVAITGYGQEHDRARALIAGFAQHLTKPVALDAVLAAIGAP